MSESLESASKPSSELEKHTHHLSQHHGELAGHQHASKRDHDFLSQIHVIPTNSGHQIVSIPVPMTIKSQIGNPTALAIGAFATTLTTLSLSLMGWRDISTNNVFIGNFFFVAGIGMVVSAQWELVLGNTYAYTVLSAFGFFYGGFGAIITPFFGVKQAYGDDMASYNNALGFWVLMWAVWNIFFLIGSLPVNLVYIGIFLTVELAFTLVAASYFAAADGHHNGSIALQKAGGVFAFLSGLLGYYTVGNLMCQDALSFRFPMGDTSKYFGSNEDNTLEKAK